MGAALKLDENQQEKIVDRILETADALSKICKDMGFSYKSLWHFRQRNPVFEKTLTLARDEAIDDLFCQIPNLVDVYADPHQARVKLDAILKFAGRMKPDKYGERLDLHINQTVDLRLVLDAAKQRTLPMLDQPMVDITQAIDSTDQYELVSTDVKTVTSFDDLL